jgi:aryl-alcohol dehydrogenase-like predicted oxidoreductase
MAARPLGPFFVNPIGFGALRITGPNAFGPPPDRRAAIALLRTAVDNGVDHIDTAAFYGPDVANELIREALWPYPQQLVIVSKVGARRNERGAVIAADAPDQLRQDIEDNLRVLGVDTLPVVNLRLMRASAPDAYFDDQLAAMIAARDDGLIASIGLSNITLEHLLYAVRVTEVACVQNAFHLANRTSQSVLDECTRRSIAFVPFASLGFGASGPDSVLDARTVVAVAARLGCTPAQVALAWALDASPNVLVIPGTSSLHHVRENLAASRVPLDADAMHQLARAGG